VEPLSATNKLGETKNVLSYSNVISQYTKKSPVTPISLNQNKDCEKVFLKIAVLQDNYPKPEYSRLGNFKDTVQFLFNSLLELSENLVHGYASYVDF
jgi:hypothetical protein